MFKEFCMKNRNKNFWLGILAIALVFTMTVIGCKESEEELRELSGTFSWNSGGIVNGIASVGTTITVNYSGTDTNNVSYQWCKNGVAIPGAVNQTFTLNEPGEYTVIVSAPGYKSRTYTIATVTETGPIPTALSWIRLQADITRGGFNSVAWGNNKFVAVGEVGKIIYSSDGINWTAASNSPFDTTISSAIRKVIWADNRFVAIGRHSGSNWAAEIAASADGITWNKLTPVFNTTYAGAGDVAYGGGTFVLASGSDNPLFYSTDAINWTKVTQTNFGGGDNVSSVYSIAYGNGKFVAAGRKGNNAYIEVSEDGISWTVNDTHFSSSNTAIGVTYRNGTFVAVGSNDGEICYSKDDGGPWQAVVKSANDITLDKGIGMYFVGSGDHQFLKFIAYTYQPASASRRMRYSQDGITWTYGDAPIGFISDLAWGDGKYVIVGSGSSLDQHSIAYSTN